VSNIDPEDIRELNEEKYFKYLSFSKYFLKFNWFSMFQYLGINADLGEYDVDDIQVFALIKEAIDGRKTKA
jgi:hypothetical protein